MTTEGYWNARVIRHGHPGWVDAAVHAYDQRLRRKALFEFLARSELRRGCALDYGCGTGFFSRALAETFDEVVATDLSSAALTVARRNAPPNVRLMSLDAFDSAAFDRRFDAIVSITVLQHIMDDAALTQLIRRFRGDLASEGLCFVLESFVRSSQAYIRSWSEAEMTSLFSNAGFVLTDRHAFPHPQIAPTATYQAYRHSTRVRVLSRLARLPFARRTLESYADTLVSADSPRTDQPTPTAVLVFRGA